MVQKCQQKPTPYHIITYQANIQHFSMPVAYTLLLVVYLSIIFAGNHSIHPILCVEIYSQLFPSKHRRFIQSQFIIPMLPTGDSVVINMEDSVAESETPLTDVTQSSSSEESFHTTHGDAQIEAEISLENPSPKSDPPKRESINENPPIDVPPSGCTRAKTGVLQQRPGEDDSHFRNRQARATREHYERAEAILTCQRISGPNPSKGKGQNKPASENQPSASAPKPSQVVWQDVVAHAREQEELIKAMREELSTLRKEINTQGQYIGNAEQQLVENREDLVANVDHMTQSTGNLDAEVQNLKVLLQNTYRNLHAEIEKLKISPYQRDISANTKQPDKPRVEVSSDAVAKNPPPTEETAVKYIDDGSHLLPIPSQRLGKSPSVSPIPPPYTHHDPSGQVPSSTPYAPPPTEGSYTRRNNWLRETFPSHYKAQEKWYRKTGPTPLPPQHLDPTDPNIPGPSHFESQKENIDDWLRKRGQKLSPPPRPQYQHIPVYVDPSLSPELRAPPPAGNAENSQNQVDPVALLQVVQSAITANQGPRLNPRDIPQFNGAVPEEILIFFDYFEEVAFVNEWSDQHKIKALRMALTEDAHAKFMRVFSHESSFNDLKKDLINIHLDTDVLVRVSGQYNQICQGARESVESYYKRFKFLIKVLHYHSHDKLHMELLAARDFQDGLYNKEMADHVSRSEPRTVDQAYNYARKEEGRAYMQRSSNAKPPPRNQNQNQNNQNKSQNSSSQGNSGNSGGGTNRGSWSHNNQQRNQNNQFRPSLWCDYCQAPTHSNERCWYNPFGPNYGNRPSNRNNSQGPGQNSPQNPPPSGPPIPSLLGPARGHNNIKTASDSSDPNIPPTNDQNQGNL